MYLNNTNSNLKSPHLSTNCIDLTQLAGEFSHIGNHQDVWYLGIILICCFRYLYLVGKRCNIQHILPMFVVDYGHEGWPKTVKREMCLSFSKMCDSKSVNLRLV